MLGGFNLYQYAPNGLTWIDPWGWSCNKKSPAKNVNKPSSWISRKIWNKLDPSLKKKFQSAQGKGIIPPKDNQGIIKLQTTEPLAKSGYSHKLKILGKGGDIRIYGKQQSNGHIIFDKLEGH
ncbi:hypothetical protein BHC49_04740 [Snodgrassella alvi]|uniref:Type IV secretion protein Rhs n=1 Tax=Snodgrassella alvi TaxID=1196083 RepID=A0A2N9XZ50_9NEIS|nr:hypothetical protein BHC49_04740 [Snodgrassella alvi]